jgi:hypothetical protein
MFKRSRSGVCLCVALLLLGASAIYVAWADLTPGPECRVEGVNCGSCVGSCCTIGAKHCGLSECPPMCRCCGPLLCDVTGHSCFGLICIPGHIDCAQGPGGG